MTAQAINQGTDDPHVVWSFPTLDLTGSSIELIVYGRGTQKSYSTEDDSLLLEAGGDGSTVTWVRSILDSRSFGYSATFDIFRTAPGGGKSKLDGGRITFAGEGALATVSSAAVQVPGLSGPPGWSPLYAVVQDGDRDVLQVADWTGGSGDKPDVGMYLGPDGPVVDIEDAADIRGRTGDTGPTGPQGVPGPTVAPTLVVEAAASFTYTTATHLNRLTRGTSPTNAVATLGSGPAEGEGFTLVWRGTGGWSFAAGANAQVHHPYGGTRIAAQWGVAHAEVVEVSGGVTHWIIGGDIVA